MRSTIYPSRPNFVVDPNSIARNEGRVIDWASVDLATFASPIMATVTVNGANSQNATTLNVTALPVALGVGQVLDFGLDEFAVVTAPAAAGATSVTVRALPNALEGGETAKVPVPGTLHTKAIKAGRVMAEIVSSGKIIPRSLIADASMSTFDATIAVDGTNTGDGTPTLDSTKTSAGVIAGVYRIRIVEPTTNLGTFIVEDPNGVIIGDGVVGTLFAGVIRFTIADGTTDFVSGDGFKVTVTETQVYKTLGILAEGSSEFEASHGKSGVGLIVGGQLYENLLPEATGTPAVLPALYKTELAAVGTGFGWSQYGDNRA